MEGFATLTVKERLYLEPEGLKAAEYWLGMCASQAPGQKLKPKELPINPCR